jgi:hypothetical protein
LVKNSHWLFLNGQEAMGILDFVESYEWLHLKSTKIWIFVHIKVTRADKVCLPWISAITAKLRRYALL